MTIRIYIADLAAYNNAILHGVWIDMLDNLDDIYAQIKQMLKDSPVFNSEETAIHDHEGFEGYEVSEYDSIEELHKAATFIDENPCFGAELLSISCGDIDEAQRMIDDQYCGSYQSLANYAEQLTEDTIQIPDRLVYYIDYEKMGNDMELSGDVFTITTSFDEVHIFWNH